MITYSVVPRLRGFSRPFENELDKNDYHYCNCASKNETLTYFTGVLALSFPVNSLT